MADPGLIIAFAHGLLLLQPSTGLSLALLRVKVQNSPHSSWYLWKLVNLCSGDCWQQRFNAKKDTAAGLLKETINAK